ncbi:DLW-39 family protein [Flaviflexus huanghaiensis]|nr:DLW-39 family protein [Flaviflexus huanghaiensis]
MKKFIIVLLASGLGYVAWLKIAADRANQAIWEQVADPVPTI